MKYKWTTRKYDIVTEDLGSGMVTARKVPVGPSTVSTVTGWEGSEDLDEATAYIESRWPGNMVTKIERIDED